MIGKKGAYICFVYLNYVYIAKILNKKYVIINKTHRKFWSV